MVREVTALHRNTQTDVLEILVVIVLNLSIAGFLGSIANQVEKENVAVPVVPKYHVALRKKILESRVCVLSSPQ